MHSSGQISQVCAAVWLQLLPARGWEIQAKTCRFGRDFPPLACIRPGLNCFCMSFWEKQRGTEVQTIRGECSFQIKMHVRVWTPNYWYTTLFKINAMNYFQLLVMFCLSSEETLGCMLETCEKCSSLPPEKRCSFFPSDQSNWAASLDSTGLSGCLHHETYMTRLQEKVLARVERNFDDGKNVWGGGGGGEMNW